MRPIHWVTIVLAANILHLWMFFHLNLETHPVATWVGIGIQVAAYIGPFWMFYDWFVKRNKGQVEGMDVAFLCAVGLRLVLL